MHHLFHVGQFAHHHEMGRVKIKYINYRDSQYVKDDCWATVTGRSGPVTVISYVRLWELDWVK